MDKTVIRRELFTLARNLHALTRELLAPIAASKGITQHHLHALMTLDIQPGLTAGELSEEIGVRKTNFAQVLRHLISSGYVETRHQTKDKRVLQVFLTESGRKLIQEIWDEVNQQCEGLILEEDEKLILSMKESTKALKELLTAIKARR